MSGSRQKLAELNSSLRAEFNELKQKKQSLSDHLDTLLRRTTQMDALKKTIYSDLNKAENDAKVFRNQKVAYIGVLEHQITKLTQEYEISNLGLKKIQDEYQICLADYDDVLRSITKEIQAVKLIEADLIQEKQNQASMEAMIFDYERLKRVLEEERRYFKELTSNQEKSHEERMRELKSIQNKLIKEGQQTQESLKLARFRSGMAKMNHLFRKKIKQYGENFLRGEWKILYKTELGIRIFGNCLELANLKHKLSTKNLFYRWHHNIFDKSRLSHIVQMSLSNDFGSRKRICLMNALIEKTNDQNLYFFHIFQKGKFVSTLANKIARKDLQYGFNKWRDNYQSKTTIFQNLHRVFNRTIPKFQLRTTFRRWKQNSFVLTRYERASHLLDEYFATKQIARIFRKWRQQVPSLELNAINTYIRNIKDRNLITTRINYEKRKTKALTILSFCMTKIKLRNYFVKYWANTKGVTVEKLKNNILKSRETFSELRVEHKGIIAGVNKNNRLKSLKIFRKFMMNIKLRPAFRKWRNTNKVLKKRTELVYHLALRKEAHLKIYVMNQFRKCVQYFQKKEMHQVLTDLNNKMEAINQKSTDYRNRLKKCVQELGYQASKKIDYIFNYSVMCQQRVYFDQDLRLKVKKLYNQYILHRMNQVLNNFYCKQSLNQISIFAKNAHKDAKIKSAEIKFRQINTKRILQKAFYGIKGSIKANKLAFKKMIHPENVFMFYRMAAGFLAVQRKCSAEKIKITQKKIASNEQLLVTKNENLENLQSQRQKLQAAVKKIFMRFITFEDRNMILKQKNVDKILTKRYFTMYRQNTRKMIEIQKTLLHFSGFLNQKNNFIFWKGVTALKYENIIAIVKEQLGQINRKKKTFQEKNIKGRGDIEKRLEEQTKIYTENKQYHDYNVNKYEKIMKYYVERHEKNEKMYYQREIFKAWKRQCQGAKRLALGANRVLQRNLVHPAFLQIIKIIKKQNSQFKSQMLCAEILLRKGRNCMKDCLIIWRCNLRKLKCDKMQNEADKLIVQRNHLVDDCKITAQLVSKECLRIKWQKIVATCFMAMKTDLTERKYLQNYQLKPMFQKTDKRLVKTAMNGWKWLMFYKKTKRQYLKHKKEKFERELKYDVFTAMKIYRQEHYHLEHKMRGVVQNIKMQYLRFALDKIINVGAYERNQLNYQRKRALRHLVMNKVSRVQIIKKKILTKWYAWLIPKDHYLPVILKTFQVVALRRAFANIRERAYWHPVYIKDAADKITNEGYNQINNATNNLVKEGFDPDEIKDYLTQRNEKDTKTIKNVVSRINTWGKKQDLVRAWNSWKQYLTLKLKIRKSLSKCMMISQGIGRYWNRWKKKDPQFNAILEKQSRGNMLQRYRDLGRLLKQYKRDVKDSVIYCEELRQINDEYSQENQQGIRIALSTLSNKLKIGLRQGMDIWRKRVRQYHSAQTDHRYDQLSQGIQLLMQRKRAIRQRLALLRQQNTAMKQKCNLGAQCGQLLQKMLKQKDNLSIDLADKQHNMKLLLQDNLRLKQKIKAAKENAQKLIHQVHNFNELEIE